MKTNPINATVYDIDGTLNKPDSFAWLKQQCGNKTIQLGYDPKDTSSPEQIAEQNKIARSPEFQERLLNDPKATWIFEVCFDMGYHQFNKIFLVQHILLSSGRWPESIENTRKWLHDRGVFTNLRFNEVNEHDILYSFVGFTEYQKYLSDKKTAIMKWVNDIISRIFNDKIVLQGTTNILVFIRSRIIFRLFDDCLDIVNWARNLGFITYLVKDGKLMEWNNQKGIYVPFRLRYDGKALR